jgi:hypothetical protein
MLAFALASRNAVTHSTLVKPLATVGPLTTEQNNLEGSATTKTAAHLTESWCVAS